MHLLRKLGSAMRIASFDFEAEYKSVKEKIVSNPDDPLCLAIGYSAFSLDEMSQVWERLESDFVLTPENRSGDRIVLIDQKGNLRAAALRHLCEAYKLSGEEVDFPL